MNIKYLALGFASLLLAFAVGRFTASGPDVTGTKEVNTDVKKEIDKDTHTTKTTTTTKKPDGEETTTTVIVKDTNTKVDETKKIDSKETVVVKDTRSPVTVSALISTQPFKGLQPSFGVSVSKPILGPVVVGFFGLDNGTFGASLGLEF